MTGNEFIDEWLFNLNPLKNPTQLAITHVSDIGADSVTTVADNSNQIPADGGGYYDIRFDFPSPQANRFGAGDTSVYDLSLTGLLESDFNFLAAPHGGNGVFHTAAHCRQSEPMMKVAGLETLVASFHRQFPNPQPSFFLRQVLVALHS